MTPSSTPPRSTAPSPHRPPPRRGSTGCAVLALLAIAALGLLAGLYPWYDADVIPKEPTLSPGTPIPEALRYDVAADQSELSFVVQAVIGKLTGHYAITGGTIELVRAGDGWDVVVSLEVDVAALDVGNAMINALMRRALGVEEYPTGVFLSHSTEPIESLSGVHTVEMDGQLELHGKVREQTAETTLSFEGDRLTLETHTPIDASRFGVSIPSVAGTSQLDATMTVVAYRVPEG